MARVILNLIIAIRIDDSKLASACGKTSRPENSVFRLGPKLALRRLGQKQDTISILKLQVG